MKIDIRSKMLENRNKTLDLRYLIKVNRVLKFIDLTTQSHLSILENDNTLTTNYHRRKSKRPSA